MSGVAAKTMVWVGMGWSGLGPNQGLGSGLKVRLRVGVRARVRVMASVRVTARVRVRGRVGRTQPPLPCAGNATAPLTTVVGVMWCALSSCCWTIHSIGMMALCIPCFVSGYLPQAAPWEV